MLGKALRQELSFKANIEFRIGRRSTEATWQILNLEKSSLNRA